MDITSGISEISILNFAFSEISTFDVGGQGDQLSSYSRTSGKNESSGRLDACKQDTEQQGQKDERPGEVPDAKNEKRTK